MDPPIRVDFAKQTKPNWSSFADISETRCPDVASHSDCSFVGKISVTPLINAANMEGVDPQEMAQKSPAENMFVAPSIHPEAILGGASYTHHSAIPEVVSIDLSTECVLGVDEAGRGPVLGVVASLFFVML